MTTWGRIVLDGSPDAGKPGVSTVSQARDRNIEEVRMQYITAVDDVLDRAEILDPEDRRAAHRRAASLFASTLLPRINSNMDNIAERIAALP